MKAEPMYGLRNQDNGILLGQTVLVLSVRRLPGRRWSMLLVRKQCVKFYKCANLHKNAL